MTVTIGIVAVNVKGGAGSGNWGHAGRPGLVGGSGGSGGGGGYARQVCERLMPQGNLDELNIPNEGLPNATTKYGDPVDVIMYNPSTGTLLAGGGGDLHAELHGRFDRRRIGEYDDFVKVHHKPWEQKKSKLVVDADRVTYRDKADAWDKAYDTLEALRGVGFRSGTRVRLRVPDGIRLVTIPAAGTKAKLREKGDRGIENLYVAARGTTWHRQGGGGVSTSSACSRL